MSLFIKKLILLLSVYDMIVAGTSKQSVVALKAHLTREFDMKDLEAVNQMLWMAHGGAQIQTE